jgi:hypothetical protein
MMSSEHVCFGCGRPLAVLKPGGNDYSGWGGCLNPDCECSIQNKMVFHFKAKTNNGDPGQCRRRIFSVQSLDGLPINVSEAINPIISQLL